MKNINRETVGLLLLVSCNVIAGSFSSHSLEQLSDDGGETFTAQPSDPRIRKSSGHSCQSHMHGLQGRTYELRTSSSAAPSSLPAQLRNRPSSAIIPRGGKGTRHPSRKNNLGAVGYWGSKRPRTSRIPVEDLAMDNNPTASSGLDQLFSSRKPERPNNAAETHCHPAAADSSANTFTSPTDACVDQEAFRPHKMVKLFGVCIDTHVDPNSIAPQRSISHHSHSSPHDTSSTVLLNYKAGTSDKAKNVKSTGKRKAIIIKSSNPQEISQASSCEAASIVDQNHVPSGHVQIAKYIGTENLRFSKDVFELSGPPSSHGGAQNIFADKLQPMLDEGLKRNELVMTEESFVKHSIDFFVRCRRDTFSSKDHESKPSQKKPINMPAYEHLLKNQQIWLEHWERQSGIDLQSEMNNVKPATINMAILFLFYVEMISTIVPCPKSSRQKTDQGHENMDTGTTEFQIEQAWNFFKHYFFKKEPAQNHHDHGVMLESNIIGVMEKFKKKYSSGGFGHKQAALWDILQIWMKMHRKSLAELLAKQGYSYNVAGVFFNFAFSHCIQKLTLQLAG